MSQTDNYYLEDWSWIRYTGVCPSCERNRLGLCENGRHWCDKCEWCPELKTYVQMSDVRHEQDEHETKNKK